MITVFGIDLLGSTPGDGHGASSSGSHEGDGRKNKVRK